MRFIPSAFYRPAQFSKKLLRTLSLSLLSLPSIAFAANPSWWTDTNYKIFDSGGEVSSEHFAPANVGQLKFVATQAYAYLSSQLSLTTADWDAAYGGSASNPFPFQPHAEDHSPVNVGQLKFIASGFYNILHDHGHELRPWLLYQGVDASELGLLEGGVWVPWNGWPLRSGNYAPANIGQLKLVFSFAVDTDGSSLFNLSSVVDNATVGTSDGDADLIDTAVEGFHGLSDSSYTQKSSWASAQDTAGISAAAASEGSEGPVVVLPDRGIYNVDQPDMHLRRL